MEKIFFIENSKSLNEINKILEEGGTVKMIQAIPEFVCGEANDKGKIKAYIVIEIPFNNKKIKK